MLAFLAALIPIAGSLFAGGSFLAEQVRLAHESRVRYRVNACVGTIEPSAERERVRELLLEANGIPKTGMTFNDFDVHFAMSGTLLPRTERQRQWMLLTSAVAGLILLCADSLGV